MSLDGGRAQGAVVTKVTSRSHAAAVEGSQPCGEGASGLLQRAGGPQLGLHAPVAGRLEGHALALALDHQTGGHRLHAPGRQARAHLAPQHRRDLVADEAIEDAASLLGIDPVRVQLTGGLQGSGDRLLGDLREGHALDGDLGFEDFQQVPGDRLSLAVIIGSEVELVSVLERLLQLGDGLLLVRVDHVVGLETVLDIDGELAVRPLLLCRRELRGLGQVADVPDGGLDVKVRAEVPRDRADLVRRLDDDELLGHVNLLRGRSASIGRLCIGSGHGSRGRPDCNALVRRTDFLHFHSLITDDSC